MQPDRREFLKHLGCLTAAGAASLPGQSALASRGGHAAGPEDPYGVLVDLTECIGCRLCEYACKQSNGFQAGTIESYDDQSVFAQPRRPSPDCHTVINAYPNRREDGKPVYAKVNCMHCNHPACASACIVGALRKQENGAVTYDAWKCIGCRYCMIACPFGVPTYEYDDVLTPEVRKCTFCHSRLQQHEAPACVTACPRNTLVFGKRRELLEKAHVKLEQHPDRYEPHIYGEHEVGGTSWMYLSNMSFQQAGFLPVGTAAPPALTEAIQHGVFKYWIAPVGWYGFLATMMWWTGRKHRAEAEARARAIALQADLEESDDAPQSPQLLEMAERQRRLAHGGAGVAEGRFSSDDSGAGMPADYAEESDNEDEQEPDEPELPAHATHGPHEDAAPADRKLLTPGVWALIGVVAVGVIFGLYRFIFGLAASTNLNQEYPWGLWIAMDVGSGIALAGGGFVTAALVHIFHREHYHAVARSALLTALLGYTFYVPGLLADIGRWYNIWHPTLPNMWQGNSVLFEVGICVMLYLNVQYAELAPIVCERLKKERRFPRLAQWAALAHRPLEFVMPALLVLGVTLSTFHQSSLGNLMVIAPYKMHPLWWTPVSPLLFLLSAMMVGFPMVIFTMLFASWSLKRRPEMHVLAPLSLYVPVFLVLYLGLKVGDVLVRGTQGHLVNGSVQGISWLVEMGLGVVLPLVMLLMPAVRRSPKWLAMACLAVILGVVLNRLNVFIIGYHPPFASGRYFPSIPELAVSAGLVAALLLSYRVAVTYLPILPRQERVAA